ncbi:hypothetical protein CB1_001073060 [Camelus ferus]|nr:hypothetical protein CB1_001073060 [Camelus ferus]
MSKRKSSKSSGYGPCGPITWPGALQPPASGARVVPNPHHNGSAPAPSSKDLKFGIDRILSAEFDPKVKEGNTLRGPYAVLTKDTMPQTYKRKRSWSRAVFSNLQRKGLEKRFEIQKYVTKPDRKQLAAMLGLTDAQVKVWFQNRRMKWRHSKEAQAQKDKDKEAGIPRSTIEDPRPPSCEGCTDGVPPLRQVLGPDGLDIVLRAQERSWTAGCDAIGKRRGSLRSECARGTDESTAVEKQLDNYGFGAATLLRA